MASSVVSHLEGVRKLPRAVDIPHAEVNLLQIPDPPGGIKQGAGEAGILQATAQVQPPRMVGAQRHRHLLVLLLGVYDHLGAQAGGGAQGGGDAGGHALQRQGHHGAPAPQHVAPRRVRIAQRRVQEHVRQPRASDVNGFGGNIREDDAGGVDAARRCLRLHVRLPVRWEPQQPQDAVWHAAQDVAPGLEGVGVVLVQLVAAGIHDDALGETHAGPRRQPRLVQHVQVRLLVVVDEVAVRHEGQRLTVAVPALRGRHHLVRDEVRQEVGACGRGEAHVAGLHRRRPQRKDLVARPLGVPIQIHRHLDLVGRDAGCDVGHRPGGHVGEMLDFLLDAAAPFAAVRRAQRVAEHLQAAAVVGSEHGGHQV
mmetsp:Transcript_2181/g.6512  ORF Transcript_2181/g.6512 Transcript_2181/m.6512 type:complete len:367 (-) Transcript_2181:3529-4629(-)